MVIYRDDHRIGIQGETFARVFRAIDRPPEKAAAVEEGKTREA
jgi:hypothetical protein